MLNQLRPMARKQPHLGWTPASGIHMNDHFRWALVYTTLDNKLHQRCRSAANPAFWIFLQARPL